MERLMARPKGHHGLEEIPGRSGAELTEELQQSSFLGRREKPDELRWAEHRRLQGGAYRVAKTRKTQGARFGRIEERKGGAAAVWWAAERVEPPWIGPVTDRTYAPGRREAGWMCRRYHLGKNKQVFDAELYALHQAVQIFDERNEQSQCCTILSDSTERARSDEMGLGQRFAVAIIEVCSRLTSRGKL